jgi:putative ABC transport system substrate-binding protein
LPRRIGVILVSVSAEGKEAQAFQRGLRDAGYSEERDIVIEWRSAGGDYSRIPAFVTDLAERKVEVIVVNTTRAVQAVKRATSTTPIVMAVVADPIGSGLVTNLAHPGGNITGLSMMTPDLNAKQLQLLKDTIPRLTRVGVIWNPDTPWHAKAVEDLKAAAPSLSVELKFVSAQTPEQLSPAFLAARREHVQALCVLAAPLFVAQRRRLVELAVKARLPTIYWRRQFVDEGGLMSYGASLSDQFRRSAEYVDKILKGAKPGDLPVEQPTQFELVVNLRTARALGLTVPQSVLQRADEVIQ